MKKQKREIDPAVVAAFEAAMERIKVVTGCYTQVTLAEVLEIRQSSISDAKRRASIPDGWLVTLLRSHKVLPDWILTGEGPQYLTNTNHAALADIEKRLAAFTEDFVLLVNRVEDSLDIIKMTNAELQRRKEFHAGRLAEDLEKAKGIRTNLETMATDAAALTH
jgi:hypothetical protein